MKKYMTHINALKYVFYLIILVLPLNLGKHFITKYAYFNGLLIDYLIPTIYLQDLLVILFVTLSIAAYKKRLLSVTAFQATYIRLVSFFILSLILSTIISINKISSIFYITHSLIYILFSIYAISFLAQYIPLKNILKTLFLTILLICILGLFQTIKQGAVFNNYLFFGEQPYSSSTYGIAKERIRNLTYVPPYATFRHPNIFAGFLSLIIPWFLYYYVKTKKKHYLYLFIFSSGLVFFTISLNSVVSLIFGIIGMSNFVVSNQKIKRLLVILLVTIASSMLVVTLLLPYLSNTLFFSNPSFYRRTYLENTTLIPIKQTLYFGNGPNTNVYYISKITNYFDIKYMQPVHNIFLLLFFENGFYGLISFLILILFGIYASVTNKNIFYITLLQIVLLGLFDHFILTQHQTNLLMWLTLCFCIAYNNIDNYVK